VRPAAAGLAALLLAFASGVPARAQTAGRPDISVPPTIAAAPATDVPFPIRVEKGPRDSFVRVRGLPATAALSEGYAIARGSWVVPLNALSGLRITLPATAAGKADMVVTLVGVDGTVLVEARSTLVIGASPPSRSEGRERALRFLRKGNERLAEGLVAPARLLYERAADLGLAEAAMALAATYDPARLGRGNLRGVQPDPKEARRWYERARALGAPEAEQRLRRLDR
jgi:hypothetical protein